MSIAFVRSNFTSGTSGALAITLPSNSAGNFLVLGVEIGRPNPKLTVSDSAGNVWQTAAIMSQATGTWMSRIFYVENCKASVGTNTITVTTSTSGFLRVAVAEYSGVATSGSFHNSRCAEGNSTSASSGSFAVSSGDLIIGIAFMNGGSLVKDAAYTSRGADANFVMEELITGSTSATATATGTSGIWTVIAAAFYAAPGPSLAPYINGDFSVSATNSESAVFASNTAGNLLLAFLETTNLPTAVTITDTIGNTWQLIEFINGVSGSFGYTLCIYGVLSCAASAVQNKVQVTATGSNFTRLMIAEYVITASSGVSSSYNRAAATSISTFRALPAATNAVIVACGFVQSALYQSPGAGYTGRKILEAGIMNISDKISSSIETPSISTSGSGEKSIIAISVGFAPTIDYPATSDVRDTITYGDGLYTGNMTEPPIDKVEKDYQYGANGNEFIGTLVSSSGGGNSGFIS